jgi:DNA-binding transcriptional LysR family regulator
MATAATQAYLDRCGRPKHPRDLLGHACLRGRFSSGTISSWEFERKSKVVKIDPDGPLIVSIGGGVDLLVEAAIAGSGVIHLFEDWLRPYFAEGSLEAILEPWWQRFAGPFLYYSGRRLVPAPLRAFIDFIKLSSPN